MFRSDMVEEELTYFIKKQENVRREIRYDIIQK
jgi:hypothetical protein